MASYEFAHEAPLVPDQPQSQAERLPTFLWYSVVDMAINTSAGAAAAAAGAHANGSTASHHVVQFGALAGLLKSAWHSLMCVVGWPHVHWLYDIVMIMVTNNFTFAELLVVVIAAITLGKIPASLCIAALPAAIPLHFELVHHVAFPVSKVMRWMYLCLPCCISIPSAWPLLLIPLDAAGGAIFAATAKGLGFPIGSASGAASAGAVFGVITSLPSVFLSQKRCSVIASLQDAEARKLQARASLLETSGLTVGPR